MRKISSLATGLIPFLNNFIILDFFIYPMLYKSSGYGIVYYFPLASFISFTIGLLVSNFSFNPIRSIRKNEIMRLILAIYLVIMIILGLSFFSVALSSIFYINETPFKFIFMILVISLFMLNIKITTLINTATILALVGIPRIFYNTISHFYLVDFGSIYYLKPSLSIANIALMAFICLDTFMYSLLMPYFKRENKKILTISVISYFIFEGFAALILVLMLGKSLEGYYGFGYFLYSVEPLSGLIDNFDFVYIFLISLSAIFKLSFSLNIIKLLYFEKKKYVVPLVFIIVALCSCLMAKYYYLVDNYLSYLLIVLAFILLGFLLKLRRMQNEYIKAYSLS